MRTDLLIAPITIGASVLIQVLIPLLITIPTGVVVYDLLLRVFHAPFLAIPGGWLNLTVQVVILYMASDFMAFLFHYCAHKNAFLWRFHSLHHSAEVLVPLTGFVRNHPFETLLSAIPVGFGAALLSGVFLFLVGARPQPESASVIASGLSVSQLVSTAWASASTFRGSDKRGGAASQAQDSEQRFLHQLARHAHLMESDVGREELITDTQFRSPSGVEGS